MKPEGNRERRLCSSSLIWLNMWLNMWLMFNGLVYEIVKRGLYLHFWAVGQFSGLWKLSFPCNIPSVWQVKKLYRTYCFRLILSH